MAEPIYKILAEAALDAAKSEGRFLGTGDDLRDGFIHLSAAHQVAGTLAKYYAGEEDLLLVALDRDLFPHLYGALPLEAILSVDRLELDDDNRHILPEGMAE
jgi:uncharacterized protein (DUF952 family)